MRRTLFSRRTRYPLFSVLLLALALRALIPVGYMPSAEQPFTLQICPDSFPAQLLELAHQSHAAHTGHDFPPAEHGSHQHGSLLPGHCIFGAAFSAAAPPPHASVVAIALEPWVATFFDAQSLVPITQRHRVQQPRAPPVRS